MAERPVALPPVHTREEPVANLLFVCPTTSQLAPTGVDTDVQSLRAAWSKKLKVQCPHCGQEHELSVRETFIEGALRDASERRTG
jgi:hypothetical protein